MKLIILLAFLLTGLSEMSHANNKKTLTLATGEFPPHISESLPHQGTFSEIVRRSFDLAGYDVQLKFVPWKRAYRDGKELKVDGTYSWTPKEDRKADFAFSDPIFVLERRVFVMDNSPISATGPEGLKGLRLCRPLAYTLHGELEEMFNNGQIDLIRPPDMITCFKFLKEGRTDFVELAHEEGITSALKAFGTLDNVRTLNFIPGTNPNALAISLDHPEKDLLLKAFNDGLAELRRTGAYKEIVERHKKLFIDRVARDNES